MIRVLAILTISGFLTLQTAFFCAICLANDSPHRLSAEAKTSTAEVFLARKDYAKAEKLLRRALDDDANYGLALNLLGQTLVKQGRDSDAIEFYIKSIKLEPENENFRLALIDTYRKLNNDTEMMSSSREFLKKFPNSSKYAIVKELLRRAEAKNGQTELAERPHQHATSPKQTASTSQQASIFAHSKEEFSFDKGIDAMNRSDYQYAIECFNHVLAKTPAMPAARTNLGISYTGYAMKLDDEKLFDQAETAYKKALEIRRLLPDKHILDATVKNYAAMLKDLKRSTDAKRIESEL